jgi:hypothetical protein
MAPGFAQDSRLAPWYPSTSESYVYPTLEGPSIDEWLTSPQPTTSETFIYTALEDPAQDGRLITLYPSPAGEDIVCDIMDVKIVSIPNFQYEAPS